MTAWVDFGSGGFDPIERSSGETRAFAWVGLGILVGDCFSFDEETVETAGDFVLVDTEGSILRHVAVTADELVASTTCKHVLNHLQLVSSGVEVSVPTACVV